MRNFTALSERANVGYRMAQLNCYGESEWAVMLTHHGDLIFMIVFLLSLRFQFNKVFTLGCRIFKQIRTATVAVMVKVSVLDV